MTDHHFYNLNFREDVLHSFTREYAAFADLVEAIDDPRNIASSYFSGLHRGLTRALGLDYDASPDEAIVAVYAFYQTHGGEATTRMLSALPSPSGVDFFAYFAARPTHPISG